MASQRASNIRKMWPDFIVTESDLSQPTTEFVMSFFERALDDMALLEFACQDHQSDQVLNLVSVADGCRKVVICTIFRHIFAKIKGLQFGIEDIIEPVPQRFGKQVDVLLHLAQYLDFYFGNKFNEVMEDIDSQSRLKDECIRESDELKNRRNQIAMENKRMTAELKAKLEEKAKYSALLDKLKEKTMEVASEHSKQKAVHDKLEAEMAALEEVIQKGNEEIEELKGSIILSPDAVYREKIHLMDKRKEVEERHAAIKSTADQKNEIAVQLEQLSTLMETTPDLIKELAEKHSFSKHLEKGFHEDESNCKKAMDKYEAARREYESRKLEVANFVKETEKMKEQHVTTCATLENELLEANRRLQEAEDEHIKKGAEQVRAAHENHIWKEKISSVGEEEKMLENDFLEQKQKIENEVHQFHLRVEGAVVRMESKLGKLSQG
ncbi:probable kinetochore protein nuf2 [Ischnura elegans]|uniref:probable kinetochore protein nuf2 n=1 Tax=Ischnura elegans TaxID=197161 RepID=UPI001ED871BD|nr:probable kinetochore protein nuf2 [Ischnura elegans]